MIDRISTVAAHRPAFMRAFGLRRLALFLAVMGPGVVTGVVDDDPTGIAGYSLAGARFGYDLLWLLILSAIALAVALEISARMGAVTGKGLGDLIRERFGVRATFVAMTALLVANFATTMAEFAGVAGAAEIFGVSRYVAVPAAAIGVYVAVALGSYRRFEIILLLSSLLLFVSYVLTGFIASPDWSQVARGSFVPTIHPTLSYLTIAIGLIGTTITPWEQFYIQAAVVDKGLSESEYRLERLDVYVGAVVMAIIAFFIIVATAATLHANGQSANSVTDVSQSLRPLAGDFAAKLFAFGVLNASLMAAAVVPLSTSYSVSEAFGWENSVNRSPFEAPGFFGLLAGQMLFGAAAVLVPGIPLLVLLVIPNVVGGMLLPIILILMLLLVNDRKIMGHLVNDRRQNIIAIATTAVILVLSTGYLGLILLQFAGVVQG